MITKIEGAIFDMDGTLIDSLIVWDSLWEKFGMKFFGKAGFRPEAQHDKALRTLTLSEAMSYINGVYHFSQSNEAVRKEAENIFRNFYANEVELKKGVPEFLTRISEMGIKMCLATATDMELVEIAMKRCGLDKFFPIVLSCADIGKSKDKPDIYLLAREKLGTQTHQTCVFEDSLVAVNTAHGIGMKTVGIYDDYNYGQAEIKAIADEYINNGETLLKLLDK